MKYRNPTRSAKSAKLFEHACKTIPGGINSTARATWSGWDPYPLFVERGEGAYLYDVDGNAYIDYLLGLGPMILGHRPPKVTAAVVEQIQTRGTVFALPTAQEAQLAAKIIAAVPSVEQVRLPAQHRHRGCDLRSAFGARLYPPRQDHPLRGHVSRLLRGRVLEQASGFGGGGSRSPAGGRSSESPKYVEGARAKDSSSCRGTTSTRCVRPWLCMAIRLPAY